MFAVVPDIFFYRKKNPLIKYRLGIKIDLNLDQGLNDWILACLNGGKTSCLPGRWVRMDGSWINIGKKLPELKKTDCVTHTTLPLHFWVPLIAGSQLLFRSHNVFFRALDFSDLMTLYFLLTWFWLKWRQDLQSHLEDSNPMLWKITRD